MHVFCSYRWPSGRLYWHLLDDCLSNFWRETSERNTRQMWRREAARNLLKNVVLDLNEKKNNNTKSASALRAVLCMRMGDVIIVHYYYYYYCAPCWQWIMLLFCISVTVFLVTLIAIKNERPSDRTMEHFNWWHNFLVFPLCIGRDNAITEHFAAAIIVVVVVRRWWWWRRRCGFVDVQKWVASCNLISGRNNDISVQLMRANDGRQILFFFFAEGNLWHDRHAIHDEIECVFWPVVRIRCGATLLIDVFHLAAARSDEINRLLTWFD